MITAILASETTWPDAAVAIAAIFAGCFGLWVLFR